MIINKKRQRLIKIENNQYLTWIILLMILLFSTGLTLAEIPPSICSQPSLPSIEECSKEIRLRLTRDIPYANFLTAIMDECDRRYKNNKSEKGRLSHIYWGVVDLLCGRSGHLGSSSQARYTGDYTELLKISLYLSELSLSSEIKEFHIKVFHTPEFRESDSEYHHTVMDLLEKLPISETPIPYDFMMILNQPKCKINSNDFHRWQKIGELYTALGDYKNAVVWFSRLPPAAWLGDLYVADTYLVWGKLDEAEMMYKQILKELDNWMEIKKQLIKTAIAEPLETTTRESIEKHIETKLNEIKLKKSLKNKSNVENPTL